MGAKAVNRGFEPLTSVLETVILPLLLTDHIVRPSGVEPLSHGCKPSIITLIRRAQVSIFNVLNIL